MRFTVVNPWSLYTFRHTLEQQMTTFRVTVEDSRLNMRQSQCETRGSVQTQKWPKPIFLRGLGGLSTAPSTARTGKRGSRASRKAKRVYRAQQGPDRWQHEGLAVIRQQMLKMVRWVPNLALGGSPWGFCSEMDPEGVEMSTTRAGEARCAKLGHRVKRCGSLLRYGRMVCSGAREVDV